MYKSTEIILSCDSLKDPDLMDAKYTKAKLSEKLPIKESCIVVERSESETGERGSDSWIAVRQYGKIFIAEMLGTAMLMCFGCMSVIKGFSAPGTFATLQPAISFGIVVTTIIQIFGHISGAHFNPAVTVCFYMLGKISFPMIFNYLAAETVGAFFGYAVLRYMTPATIDVGENFCCTIPHETLSVIQALAMEFCITSLLLLTLCSAVDDRNAHLQDSMPIKFGLVVAGVSMFAAPYTGASMNPARSLGPALFNGVWAYHWVYWVAPLLSGFLVPFFYQNVFNK